jgi:hypothetical protein
MRQENNFGPYAARGAEGATRSGSRRVDHACSPRQLCARCSLMKVIHYRFKAFERAFGRSPGVDEPLFFISNSSHPSNAGRELMLTQLKQAADATGVQFSTVAKFLGL